MGMDQPGPSGVDGGPVGKVECEGKQADWAALVEQITNFET